MQGVDDGSGAEATGESDGAGPNGAAGTGRRRRRGGRGRNRRERGEGEAAVDASDSALAADAFAERASGQEPRDASPVVQDHESYETSAMRESPVHDEHREVVETVASAAASAPTRRQSPFEADPVASLPSVTADMPAEADPATTAPIVGETDPATVMETLPSADPVEPVPVFEAVVEPVVQPVVEPVMATPAAPVAAPAPVPASPKTAPSSDSLIAKAMASAPPPADLQSVLSNAGLQLVNTDARKLESARADGASVAPSARPVRERKQVAPPVQEPLAQVETRKH